MYNKKVIVLWGSSNHGKTTTLKMLIEKLEYLSTVIDKSTSGTKDCWIVMKYRDKNIAIITAGDDGETIKSAFDSIKVDCDIYICASRSKGETVRYLESRFSKDQIIWQGKWSVSSTKKEPLLPMMQNITNNNQVLGLMHIIDLII